MSRVRKRILWILGGTVGLLGLLAWAAVLLVDVNHYKPRLEAAASDALGMDVHIGRLRMGLFPGPHLTAEDGRILDEQGATVVSTKSARLWVRLSSLIRGEFRLSRIELAQPRLLIVRDLERRLNLQKLRKALGLLSTLDRGIVSLSDGSLSYTDRRSREGFEATGLDLSASRIRLAQGRSAQDSKIVSAQAEIACREIRTKNLTVSALRISVDGKDGVFQLDPVTMQIFGGQAVGSIRADVHGPIPLYQVRCSLPRFRIEEFLQTLSPKKASSGAMDFSASLAMRGNTVSQMVQTATGEASLRGKNLVLEGTDLDHELSRFKSSQNFNLVDVGAVFFAGPLGLAVTKGYNFASLFEGSGGTSRIETLLSNWRVERGIAGAKDVAMAMPRNRIALRGGLDFVRGEFADVTVAVIDARGCAKVRQTIRGSFANPVVEKPRMLRSLAGPMVKLYKATRGLFPAVPCEVFYSGSVPPPR
jgi:uncharacterized protein involved in outer membrane biogenesis